MNVLFFVIKYLNLHLSLNFINFILIFINNLFICINNY